MPPRRLLAAVPALLVLLGSTAAPADAPAEPPPVVTQHTLALAGRTISYHATAGRLPVANKAGEVEAHVFFVAYTKDGVEDPSQRRLTFAFNGGPGAAAIWLHLGALGPKRAALPDDGTQPAPPYALAANEETLLDETDLVFIDPVGTGYSRPVRAELQGRFSTRSGDVESVGEFVRLYLTRHRRWRSPLFVMGESYGTTRAAALADHLFERGIALSGVMLVSMVLDFQTIHGAPGNDVAFPLSLPTYAAVAWYHRRLAEDLQALALPALLSEVQAWAAGPYATALLAGDRLGGEARAEIVRRVARYTGLDPGLVEQADLRVDLSTFRRELLRAENRVVGRFDGRLTAHGARDASRYPDLDPSLAAVHPPLAATFADYVRGELGYESDLPYHAIGGEIGRWDSQAEGQYVNVADSLRRAMVTNAFLRVYVGQGLYDLATPFAAGLSTLDHLGLPEALRASVRRHAYEAGHMYYTRAEERRAMKRDLAAFLAWAAP